MSDNNLTQLIVEITDHVAVLRMHCPPVNALSRVLNDELTDTLDSLSETDEVRAIVLTGEGRVFCAGADLKARAFDVSGPGAMRAQSRRTRECFHALRECSKPVVAALNGPALGSGLAMAASCDVLIAAERGSLGLPEIDVGLMGGARHAMRLFSHSLLRRMVLTGYRVPAAELHRLGVVEACVPDAELLETAMALARNMASKSPVSIRMAKQTLNVIEELSLRDGYRFEQDMTATIACSKDAQEAQRAFIEKRAPVFVGR